MINKSWERLNVSRLSWLAIFISIPESLIFMNSNFSINFHFQWIKLKFISFVGSFQLRLSHSDRHALCKRWYCIMQYVLFIFFLFLQKETTKKLSYIWLANTNKGIIYKDLNRVSSDRFFFHYNVWKKTPSIWINISLRNYH